MFTRTKSLPKVLTFGQAKYYIFSAVFVGLAVFVPWLTHQFHLAGPKFLPMHFFVLIAGFLLGWRVGLVTAVAGSLISYSLTHLPPMIILPQVIIEVAVYGFTIGILREKNINIWLALPLAMIFGRLARFAMAGSFGFIAISWPGIALQLILIPLVIFICSKILKNSQKASGS